MEVTRVIQRPILTEKTNNLQQQHVYSFQVDWKANKYQIKQAVEFIFQVKVLSVNTLKMDKKPKRVGRFNGFTNRYKKAMVTLAEGDVIHFYPSEANEEDKNAAKEAKKAKAKVEKAKAQEKEAKLAEKLAAKKASKSTKEKVAKEAKSTTKATTKKTTAKSGK